MRTYEPTVQMVLLTLRCDGCQEVWTLRQKRREPDGLILRQYGAAVCSSTCTVSLGGGTTGQAPLTVLSTEPILEMYHLAADG